jgi:hypothetical protein
MSYLYGFSFPDPMTGFLTTIIGQFTKLLSVAPPGNFGGTIDLNLEYASEVSTVESTLLNFEGLVQYLYIKVYGTAIPTTPTDTEKEQIYSIYDALKVARPIL